MLICSPGIVTPLSNVVPGTVFGAKLRDSMHLALAIEPKASSGPPDAVMLIPGHPQLNGQPGLLLHSGFERSQVFAYKAAAIEYDADLLNVHIGHYGLPDDNRILWVLDNKIHIRFASDRYQTSVVDLETGLYSEPDLSSAAAILKWRIVYNKSAETVYELGSVSVEIPEQA